jgi:hypothetical protein
MEDILKLDELKVPTGEPPSPIHHQLDVKILFPNNDSSSDLWESMLDRIRELYNEDSITMQFERPFGQSLSMKIVSTAWDYVMIRDQYFKNITIDSNYSVVKKQYVRNINRPKDSFEHMIYYSRQTQYPPKLIGNHPFPLSDVGLSFLVSESEVLHTPKTAPYAIVLPLDIVMKTRSVISMEPDDKVPLGDWKLQIVLDTITSRSGKWLNLVKLVLPMPDDVEKYDKISANAKSIIFSVANFLMIDTLPVSAKTDSEILNQ